MERVDQVMAGRGFQIKEELLLHFFSLKVPAGPPMKSQVTSAEVTNTKDVAELRIHVEREINWFKSFRILKNTFSILLL